MPFRNGRSLDFKTSCTISNPTIFNSFINVLCRGHPDSESHLDHCVYTILGASATRLVFLTSSTKSPKYLPPLRLHSRLPLTQHFRPVTYCESASLILVPQLGKSSLKRRNSSTSSPNICPVTSKASYRADIFASYFASQRVA